MVVRAAEDRQGEVNLFDRGGQVASVVKLPSGVHPDVLVLGVLGNARVFVSKNGRYVEAELAYVSAIA